jgi:hypothetical protein
MYGPSRFVWFTIGSVATLAWIHSHRNKDTSCCPARIAYGTSPRAQREHGTAPPYGSAGGGGNSPSEQQQQQQQQYNASWGWRRGVPDPRFDTRAPINVGAGSAQHGSVAAEEAPPPALPSPGVIDLAAEKEFERLRQIGRNAEETVRVHFLG